MGGRLCQARYSTLQGIQHSPVEGFWLLDVAEVPGGGDEHELGAWDLGVHGAADLRGCQPVVLAEHEQRRDGDLRCPRARASERPVLENGEGTQGGEGAGFRPASFLLVIPVYG